MRESPKMKVGEFQMEKIPTKNCTVFDEQWTIKNLKKRLRIVVVRCDENEIEFDLIGIHPGLANTFRRIMISDIPSMAIERVQILNNTSIIPDEVLTHRFGLIPLKADPRLFEFKSDADPAEKDVNTLEFEIKVKCTSVKENTKNSLCAEDIYKNSNVYSSQIKWLPIGDQRQKFKEKDIGPIHPDILIAKMRPSHEIDCKLIAVKGIGRDHAKFSPVVAAFYRLLPEIKIIKEVSGEAAERLQKCFAPGVIEVKKEEGKNIAVVKDARYDTGSRNVLKFPDLKDSVVINRVEDHMIFTIESVGALKPDDIFRESVKYLKDKCLNLLQELNS
ncbi:DNA-directed RNA polymerases I and III subunit RPAC1 [Coccinella septempunctata]|uniref:DNA-directed RNA polymerases I and III subunit RPAC1 n=1 Tax=Coccinella septempunctata TaxID=41139 RepID=UPI001D06E5C4|nr:DNA-directed RNA polymerases I and III subunit RPAC1 [Coccinella septempunctata]